jgi:8-oxo-dGTP pyrophosphatase MutT (NUDIX family)
MTPITYVPKACAYVTRDGGSQLLVFEGPHHAGQQIPKGTVEAGEGPREALVREVREETGLRVADPVLLAADLWVRRPGRVYVRHFFHTEVEERRDEWHHAVTGEGCERGDVYQFSWLDLPTDRPLALDLDAYLDRVTIPVAPRSPTIDTVGIIF